MNDSAKVKCSLLEAHLGQDITVILDSPQNNLFQGVLSQETVPGTDGFWVITSPRGAMQRGHQAIVVPETKIFFLAEDLKHIVVRQETEQEAADALAREQDEAKKQKSRLVGPDGGQLQ
jgi:hypothetical protein